MTRQQVHDRGRVLQVCAHPRVQAAHTTQRQEAVERRAGQPQAVRPPCDFFQQCDVADHDRASNHVAVPIQVLGGGVNHDIRAQCERLLQGRRQEGVVGNYDGIARVRLRGEAVDVDDAQERIAGRLDPHHARLLRERVGDGNVIRLINERHAEVCLARECIEQAIGAAITVVGGNEQISRPEQMREQRDRGHARRCHHGAGTPFEVRQRVCQQIARGIAAARVIVLPLFAECAEAERR